MRETLCKSLAGAMGPLAGRSDILRLLDLGGRDLIFEGHFSQPDRTVVDIIIPMAGREDGRRWLAGHAAEVRQRVDGADVGSRETLRAVRTGASGDPNADALRAALDAEVAPKFPPDPQPKPKPKPKKTLRKG